MQLNALNKIVWIVNIDTSSVTLRKSRPFVAKNIATVCCAYSSLCLVLHIYSNEQTQEKQRFGRHSAVVVYTSYTNKPFVPTTS